MMKEIAKSLGIDLFEPFRIFGAHGKYRIAKNWIEVFNGIRWHKAMSEKLILRELEKGKLRRIDAHEN